MPEGGYANWLWLKGVNGAGVIVQIMDDGLSRGNASNAPARPCRLLGRIIGIDNFTSDPTGNSTAGHGTLTPRSSWVSRSPAAAAA